MSGKLGGAVAARAKGGIQYFRALIIPTNPSTFLQTAIRSAVSSVSAAWQSVLTELQQQAWFDAAEGSQSGKSLFGKLNQARIYANNTGRVTDDAGLATTDFNLITEPPESLSTTVSIPTATIDDSANTLDIGTIPGGSWNDDASSGAGSAVFVYMSAPQQASRLARKGSYMLVRAFNLENAGDFDTPAINLAALGIPTVAGYVAYVKVYVQDPYGGVSVPVEQRVTIVA